MKSVRAFRPAAIAAVFALSAQALKAGDLSSPKDQSLTAAAVRA